MGPPIAQPPLGHQKGLCVPESLLRFCHRTVCLPPDPGPVQPLTHHQSLGPGLGAEKAGTWGQRSPFTEGETEAQRGAWLPLSHLECPWQAEDQRPWSLSPTQFSVHARSSGDTENGSRGCRPTAHLTAHYHVLRWLNHGAGFRSGSRGPGSLPLPSARIHVWGQIGLGGEILRRGRAATESGDHLHSRAGAVSTSGLLSVPPPLTVPSPASSLRDGAPRSQHPTENRRTDQSPLGRQPCSVLRAVPIFHHVPRLARTAAPACFHQATLAVANTNGLAFARGASPCP